MAKCVGEILKARSQAHRPGTLQHLRACACGDAATIMGTLVYNRLTIMSCLDLKVQVMADCAYWTG